MFRCDAFKQLNVIDDPATHIQRSCNYKNKRVQWVMVGKMRPESILARIDSGFRDIAGFEERLSITFALKAALAPFWSNQILSLIKNQLFCHAKGRLCRQEVAWDKPVCHDHRRCPGSRAPETTAASTASTSTSTNHHHCCCACNVVRAGHWIEWRTGY